MPHLSPILTDTRHLYFPVMFSLKDRNTFRIPCFCRRFAEFTDTPSLAALVAQAHAEHLPILAIGGGSNLLFVDDFPGLVLHSAITAIECVGEDQKHVLLRVGSGMVWDEFVAYVLAQGWSGPESLSDIPGEVGASAVQNIGAYGAEAAQFIVSVEVYDMQCGESRTIPAADIHYGYRYSHFKGPWAGQFIITHVTYRVNKHYVPRPLHGALVAEMARQGLDPATADAATVRRLTCAVRRSKLPWPEGPGSAGSFFMNPTISARQAQTLLAQYPDMPHYALPNDMVKVPAAWLIDQCGWKGRSIGPAGVWHKQPLVLVNNGGATGRDICRLADAIVADVHQRFGITLHPEAIYIGGEQ